MRAVARAVAGRLVIGLADVLPAEAVVVVTGPDDLVVAGRRAPVLAGDALAVPVRRYGDAGIPGERRVLGPDPGVDDADDDPGAGVRVDARELIPQAARRVK